MKYEMENNFYCSAGLQFNPIREFPNCVGTTERFDDDCEGCFCHHRKYPTPEQYKEEYGEEVPDEMAVWFKIKVPDMPQYSNWEISTYIRQKKCYETGETIVVCACTPFGKPDKDWRP